MSRYNASLRNNSLGLPLASFVLLLLLPTFALLAEEQVVLGAGSKWRQNIVFFPPAVSEASAKAAGKETDLESRRAMLEKRIVPGHDTYLLPSDWTTEGFDDSGWLNRPGLTFVSGDGRAKTRNGLPYVRGVDYFLPEIGLLALRNKFIVKDPKKVKSLVCTLKFRGGFVLYVNGKEVGRGFMPEGAVTQETPSLDYDLEVFIAEDKRKKMGPLAYGYYGGSEYKDLWIKRERDAEIVIDASNLVVGENCIAVEVHRSEYPIECKSKKNGHGKSGRLAFATVGLSELFLKANSETDNVIGAVSRPAGFQVWNVDSYDEVRAFDYANPAADLRPIEIAAARNGHFNGQIVLSADQVIKNINVSCGELRSESHVLDPKLSEIRFGAINPTKARGVGDRETGKGSPRFDLLLPEISQVDMYTDVALDKDHLKARASLGLPDQIKPGSVLPIWVLVTIPKDAAAGVYVGSVSISADGMDAVLVPVHVHVSEFVLPDVKDYAAALFLWQSPDTLAQYYEVEMWSEKHWALIDQSLKYMGEMGNMAIQFPLFAESAMGNPHGMVPWIKQGDGSYTYDFTNFDRYLKTALKYHHKDRLKILSLRAWGYEMSGHPKKKTPPPGYMVSVKDESGKLSLMTMPIIFESPESEKLITPFLQQLYKRLADQGLADKVCYGNGGDKSPSREQAGMLDRILPGTPWVRDSHFASNGIRSDVNDKNKKVPVRSTSMVWGGGIPNPHEKRLYGWNYDEDYMQLNFNRAGVSCLVLNGQPSPWSFRMWMESTFACGRNGNGRVGVDFFNLGVNLEKQWGKGTNSENKGGSGGTLFGSYSRSAVGQIGLGNNCTDLLGPGPEGIVSTVRLENARSGNQEAEARAIIERALVEKKIDGELAARCQAHLDRRTNAIRLWALNRGGVSWGQINWFHSSKTLFDLAAQVQAAL